MVPSSLTTVFSSDPLMLETNRLRSCRSTSSLIGRLSFVPRSVSPSWSSGPCFEAGSKERYCSPTALRLCTYTGEAAGIFASSSSATSTRRPLSWTAIFDTSPILTPRYVTSLPSKRPPDDGRRTCTV
jgi:hypothetical protein